MCWLVQFYTHLTIHHSSVRGVFSVSKVDFGLGQKKIVIDCIENLETRGAGDEICEF